MIVRKEKHGGMTLVAQIDHSRMVGQLAAQWGNQDFATPTPFDSVVRAAAFHDFGWLRYETAPLFDTATGETPEFRRVPTTDTRLAEYDWVHDWLLGEDAYSSLIANMHRTGLWRERYQTIDHPRDYAPSSECKGAIEAFVVKNEARQAKERRKHDEQEIWMNYRLLQVWDLLGLYFGCQSPHEDYIEPCPVKYGSDESVRLTLTPAGRNKVKLDPFPFNRPWSVQLACKRLPQTKFPDEATFRRAYVQARTEIEEFELV